MILGEISSALSIVEKLAGLWKKTKDARKIKPETVATRFFLLFECHDVHRNQIPRFFGNELTLLDVQSEDAVLPKLNDEVLEAACDLFAVRREWLDCADERVFEVHDFYKDAHKAAAFLEALKQNSPEGNVSGVLLAPEEKRGPALIVLSEAIGNIGVKPIYRYHLLGNWVFDYWKSRAHLTAVIALAWKQKAYIRGAYFPAAEIEALDTGEILSVESYAFKRMSWYPEDMALLPETYLAGLSCGSESPEAKLAVEMWLNLEAEGLMETGLEMYNKREIRERFAARLETS